MTINKFDPVRINPDEDGYVELAKAWFQAGQPRTFDYMEIVWMQITDTQGVCFVPTRGSGGLEGGYYDHSSFQKMNG